MKRLFLIIFICLPSLAFSQEKVLSEESVEKRTEWSELKPKSEKNLEAEAFAVRNNIPVRQISSDGKILQINSISPNGVPKYFKTENLSAAKTTSTDKVWENGGLGLSLTGSGVVVGIWDGGSVRKTHVEFGSRVRIINSSAGESYHATHVAGTVGASGIRSGARGMASGSTLDSYDWSNDNEEMENAAGSGMLISNHSYGYIMGWEYDSDASKWKWYGDITVSETEDYLFGYYGEDARAWDAISHEYPNYLIVKSAGNDRGDGPSPGTEHFVWKGGAWQLSTDSRDIDGKGGYDCIGTQGTSKNILTVGAIDDLPFGFQDPADVMAASFSCFGPTDDGRIKPDIVGNGISLLSSSSDSDNAYAYSSGTSMSSPNVSGSLALLQGLYRKLHNRYMPASLLKALVIHTADDAGPAGPDYRYGWGVLNTASAAQMIADSSRAELYTDTLFNQASKAYEFYSMGMDTIEITIVWMDPPGDIPPVKVDPTNKILVNDLDIRLTRITDGKVFSPYILFPTSPAKQAETGDNSIDNVEKIYVTDILPGYYTLTVSHKFSLDAGFQVYSLVVSGLTEEYVASGYNVVESNNGEILLTSAAKYQNNMDVQWLLAPESNEQISMYFKFFNTEENSDTLYVYDGEDATADLLAVFTGSLTTEDTLIQSSGTRLYLRFVSNEAVTEEGFNAVFCTTAPAGNVDIVGEEYVCAGKTFDYYVIGPSGTDYNWRSHNDWELTELSQNGVSIQALENDDILYVQPYNRCGQADEVQQQISSLVSVPVLSAIEGDTLPCMDIITTYTTDEFEGATYSWVLPDSWLGASSGPEITIRPVDGGDAISVTAINSCGASELLSVHIEIQDVPVSDFLYTDKTPPCEGADQWFYVKSKEGYSYKWSVYGDWQIAGNDDSDSVLITVGTAAQFLDLLATNKCGENRSSRLFLTAPKPDAPELTTLLDDDGILHLYVVDAADFSGIQWYYNGLLQEKISGSSIIPSRNGLYTVASVSDKGCLNLLAESDGVLVDRDDLTFISYRTDPETIMIENSLNQDVEYNLINMRGEVVRIGLLNPGLNQVSFNDKGVFLIHFFGYGSERIVKSLF